jgi:hypothetical protein
MGGDNPRVHAQLERIRDQVKQASRILQSAAAQEKSAEPSLPRANAAISSVMN